jgi:peptide/nickel transport system permease protein
MLTLVVKRLAVAIATMLAVSVVMFFGIEAMPGDAATAALGQQATPARLEALRAEYGLNRPAPERYLDWLGGFATGDLGTSLSGRQPVSDLIGENIRNSAVLAALVILLLVPLAIGLGVLSALWRDRLFDYGVAVSTLTFISTPEFVVGSVLIVVFSTALAWLPASSLIDPSASLLSQWQAIVLPVATLVLVSVAQATRMIRSAVIDVLQSDYVMAARLRGVPPRSLLFRHVLPNSFDSTIQIIALTIGFMIGGVVVTETLFQYPGLGTAIADAVRTQDVPTVLSASMLVTAVWITANLLADLAILAVNPRLRKARA